MARSGTPTVVMVHGALGSGIVWELVGRDLDARGIAHIEVDLPSHGDGVDPTSDVHGDAAHVRRVLDGLGTPVVLCGNSYGGTVITEAAAGHPAVGHLVYLAAFMPDADDDLALFMPGNTMPDAMGAAVFREDGMIEGNPDALTKVALQQAPPDVVEWALPYMRPMAGAALGGGGTVRGVAWRGIPSTFVVCSDDRTIEPDSQRRWAKERATYSIELPFDHCPQVSHPAEVAEILAKVVSELPG